MAGPEYDRFGDLIKRARITAGLTQEELAELAGLSVRAVGDIERARTARPRRGSAELLARALRLPDAGDGRIVGAPGCGGVVPRQLPHALAGFVGREAEMTTLTGLLDRSGGSPGTVVISAIGGTAGVGVHP
jgi:transcriptional regulator with XRE-family HTH domain